MEMSGGNTTLLNLQKTAEMHGSYMKKSGGLKNTEMWR